MKRFLLLLSCSLALLLSFPPSSLAANCSAVGDQCCVNIMGNGDKTCSGGLICIADKCADKGSLKPLCGTGVDLNLGVNTAIGCLMAGDPKQLVSQLLGWGVGIGGGIAFLMIIFAGFQMTTASGDPKRVKAAQELLTSALAGLILIVLSVVLLNFIGVNILGLNNLGFSL